MRRYQSCLSLAMPQTYAAARYLHVVGCLAMLVVSLMLSACSAGLIPFTQGLRVEHQLTDSEIQQLQYYVSGPIRLERVLLGDNRKVKGGKLIVVEGRTIHRIVVDKDTPGVAVKSGHCWMNVSFEKESDGFLSFGVPSENCDKNGFRHKGDEGRYWLYGDFSRGLAPVLFENEEYDALPPSGRAYLLIDKNALSNLLEKTRKLPGRRLEGEQK